MRHATLRQLQVFEAIARHLSFTRAAEELYLTQPTVSMQMKQLTDTVGMPLFEQIGKRIHLTDAGKDLCTLCREVFDSLERFEMNIADRKGLKQGRLRLAVITTAKYFAPRVLGAFCQRYPGIEVSLKVTNGELVLLRLTQNLDDLYILGQPPESLDAHSQSFMENPLVVLAPSGHPLVGRKRISLKRIAEEPFLMREIGSGTRIATQRLFDEHKIKLNMRMDLGSNEAIKQAIVGGLGLAVLSRHCLALEGDTGPLRVLDVQGFPIKRHWYLVYPEGKQLSIAAQTFYSYLLHEGKHVAEHPLL
jgi:DNA-binding transcriptional LysR family regulator